MGSYTNFLGGLACRVDAAEPDDVISLLSMSGPSLSLSLSCVWNVVVGVNVDGGGGYVMSQAAP